MMKVFKYLLLLLLGVNSFIYNTSGTLPRCSPPRWFLQHSAPAGYGQVCMLCSGSLPPLAGEQKYQEMSCP